MQPRFFEDIRAIQELVDTLPVAIFTKDADSRFLFMNKACEAQWGLSFSDLKGTDGSQFFPPDQMTQFLAKDKEIFAGGCQVDFEETVWNASFKQNRTSHTFKKPIYDDSGKPLYLICVTIDITEHQRVFKETEAQLRRNQTLMKTAFDGIHIMDDQGNIVEVNDSFCNILGYTHKEASRLNIADWNAQYSRQELQARLQSFIGRTRIFETVHRRRDGTLIDVEVNITGTEIEGRTYFFATSRDITSHKLAEQRQYRLTRALTLLSRCNLLLGQAHDENGLLTEICKLAVETGGYRMAWVGYAGQDAARTVRPVAQSGDKSSYVDSLNITWSDTERGRGPTGTAIRTGKTAVCHDVQADPAVAIWSEATIRLGLHSVVSLPLVVERRVLGALIIYSSEPNAFDQEEVKLLEELANNLAYGIKTLRLRLENSLAQEKLEFLAHHDPLTGLPNRLLLIDRYNRAVALAKRDHTHVAVLFLDLDNFKQVNDSLGHGYGDRLMVSVAQRLQACIREADTISRQGGDEFVILLTNMTGLNTIETIVQNISDVFIEPFDIDGYILDTSCSIGISVFPGDGWEFDTLLRHADTALYHAKDSGRNTYRFFKQTENVQLQDQLGTTIWNQKSPPDYQSQIAAVTKQKTARSTLLLQSEILMHVQEGVHITRAADGTIVYTTPVFNRMFGYAENELVGQKVSVLNAPTERNSEQIAEDINHILIKSNYWQGEIKSLRKDGSAFWCWAKVSSFEHHKFGKVWVAVHEDITRRKQIEMDLEQARVAMHRDLLVREVHHRVKNNLQGVTGVLRLFAAKHPELTGPFDQVISQVQSIAVIHGLQGKSGQNTVLLCEMTLAIAASIESMWNRRISIDIPSNWIPRNIVESEAVPMALVINELLANAVKHGDADTEVAVTLRLEPDRDTAILSISNFGSIPAGFGLDNPDLLGTGLQLLASLLPQNGIKLYWDQRDGTVATILEVGSPILSLQEPTGDRFASTR